MGKLLTLPSDTTQLLGITYSGTEALPDVIKLRRNISLGSSTIRAGASCCTSWEGQGKEASMPYASHINFQLMDSVAILQRSSSTMTAKVESDENMMKQHFFFFLPCFPSLPLRLSVFTLSLSLNQFTLDFFPIFFHARNYWTVGELLGFNYNTTREPNSTLPQIKTLFM